MKESIKLLVIGMLMGAAEVVPGISGGTIAFVTGIYERFVNALRRFEPKLLLDIRRRGLKASWSLVDASFLLRLFAGMAVSIFLFAGMISYLLAEQAILIWSFFFGLVLASVWLIVRQMTTYGWQTGFFMGMGCAFGLMVATLAPVMLEPTPINIFIGGVVAVCAWVLPGLSGSFILLILGLYSHLLEAIKTLDILFLLTLGAGCAIGIVAFAQMLSRLFRRYRNETLAVLTGFMLGSLVKLWPWQNTTSYQLKADGAHIPLVQDPVSPASYALFTGHDPEISMAILGLMLGLMGVVALYALSQFGLSNSAKSKELSDSYKNI